MTTLYRPVLIESVEQAEALPVGAVAVDVRETATYVAVKHAPQAWWHARHRFLRGSSTILGFEALVPIAAEEETRVTPEALTRAAVQVLARAEGAARAYAPPPLGRLNIQQQTRLATPWEPA